MFQIRWKPAVETRRLPDALQWWEQSVPGYDPSEQIVQLTQQLRTAIARAGRSERPLFLRALGRELDTGLQELAGRIASGIGDSGSELTQRRQLLEEMVDYYCDAVMPWTRATCAVELSDCVREAVAGLSADMRLVLRVEGEPLITAGRRHLIALCELAIRAATAHPDDDVEVVLSASSDDHYATLRVQWPSSPLPRLDGHDKARFLALTLTYLIKLGGTLQCSSGAEESVLFRIPMRQRVGDELFASPTFHSDVVDQTMAFCLEG